MCIIWKTTYFAPLCYTNIYTKGCIRDVTNKMAVYQLNSANIVDIYKVLLLFLIKKQDDTVHQKSSINLILPFFKDYIQSKCCSIPPLQDALSQYCWMNYLKIIRAATLTFILAAWLDWNTHRALDIRISLYKIICVPDLFRKYWLIILFFAVTGTIADKFK